MEEILKSIYGKLFDLEDGQAKLLQEISNLKKENRELKLNLIIMNPNSSINEKREAMAELYNEKQREEEALPSNVLK